MNFIQPNFLVFLFIFAGLYRFLGQRARIGIGIIGSFYFYSYFSPLFSLLLLFSSILDYFVGKALYQSSNLRTRRCWLLLSLVSNLGLLAIFKYASFCYNSLAVIFPNLGTMEATSPPMGISFFTFQTLSYTLDIYRGQLAPTQSFRKFLFYVSFFPQLVAGPIVRAKDFLPQIDDPKQPLTEWRDCLWRFSRGFIKKACLADGLGILLVDPIHADLASASPLACWLAVIAYGLQLYLDFSGYSDMAIAIGRLLGFKFPENFNHPYLATSFSDFWKRWHISLSSWLKDYLYISLGGNRRGPTRVQANLMITMLLGGLWHGANWTFVIWGGLNGLFLVMEHRASTMPFIPSILKRLSGRVWVIAGWFGSLVFFRSESCEHALLIFSKLGELQLTHFSSNSYLGFEAYQIFILLFLAMSGHLLASQPNLKLRLSTAPCELRLPLLASVAFWAIHFYPSGQASPFIYFQF